MCRKWRTLPHKIHSIGTFFGNIVFRFVHTHTLAHTNSYAKYSLHLKVYSFQRILNFSLVIWFTHHFIVIYDFHIHNIANFFFFLILCLLPFLFGVFRLSRMVTVCESVVKCNSCNRVVYKRIVFPSSFIHFHYYRKRTVKTKFYIDYYIFANWTCLVRHKMFQ